jgi:hypothetical protein
MAIAGVIHLRIQRKRPQFQDTSADELSMGYISVDGRGLELWFKSHPNPFADHTFACGFVLKFADPVHSIVSMIYHEPKSPLQIAAIVWPWTRMEQCPLSVWTINR